MMRKLPTKFITVTGWSLAESVHVPLVFLVLPVNSIMPHSAMVTTRKQTRNILQWKKSSVLREKLYLHEQCQFLYEQCLGVSNVLIQVLAIFGLYVNCSHKLDECLLVRARKVFETASMLGFWCPEHLA